MFCLHTPAQRQKVAYNVDPPLQRSQYTRALAYHITTEPQRIQLHASQVLSLFSMLNTIHFYIVYNVIISDHFYFLSYEFIDFSLFILYNYYQQILTFDFNKSYFCSSCSGVELVLWTIDMQMPVTWFIYVCSLPLISYTLKLN